MQRVAPLLGVMLFLLIWHLAVSITATTLVPGPLAALLGIVELAQRGLLVPYVVASLFRVTWGYFLAALMAIPLGFFMGMSRRLEWALNPLLQLLRPISPLAWIPIAILFFGVGDLSAVFLIFLASFFPIATTSASAVKTIDSTHMRAGMNFGLTRWQLLRDVVGPAALPQIIVGMRIALGVAWLVVVAAEMIAVSSGLGFLIIDARNAGNRNDLVVSGMVLIGCIGLFLDGVMRRLEKLEFVRWGFSD